MGQLSQPAPWRHRDGVRHPFSNGSWSWHGGGQSFPTLPAVHPGAVGRPGHPERLRSPPGVPAGKYDITGCSGAMWMWSRTRVGVDTPDSGSSQCFHQHSKILTSLNTTVTICNNHFQFCERVFALISFSGSFVTYE